MRIIRADWESGEIVLVPEFEEDLYYLSFVIKKGDIVYSWTTRTTRPPGGGERGEKEKVYLGIIVEKIEFQRFTNVLRVLGKILDAPDNWEVKGKYHAIKVYPGLEIKLVREGGIGVFEQKILKKAVKRSEKVLLVSIGEESAVFSILRPEGVEIKFIVENPFRKEKFYGGSFDKVLRPFIRNIVNKAKNTLPDGGRIVFLTTSLIEDILREELFKHRISARIIRVSEGGVQGIYEALRREVLRGITEAEKISVANELLEEIFSLLSSSPNKVAIGLEEITTVAKIGAIEKILVLDDLMFARREVVSILNMVEQSRGEVIIVSSASEPGERLKGMGGIAALLRYPVRKGE